jgi:chemotaxis protein CheX
MSEQIERIDGLTRQAVKRVFQSMVSREISAEPPSPLTADPQGEVMGSVGFIGEATGVVYIHSGMSFARTITSRLLGIPETEVDTGEMLTDAIGELTNMVVGYVKSRLCDAGFTCTLTIPSVVRGHQLKVQGASQVTRRMIGFRDGQQHLLVEILLKASNPK